MMLRVLGVSWMTTVCLLAACGDDSDGAGGMRRDAGSMLGPDAGAGGRDAGQGGEDAGKGGRDAGMSDGGQDAGPVTDGGAGDAGDGIDFVSACLDEAESRDSRTEKLKMSGDGTSVGIVRYVDPDAFGTSGTTSWLPERFVVARGATAKCITTPAQLTYHNSRHNFDDELTASEGDVTWIWKQTREDYGFPTQWTVEARQDDQLLWGPVDLTLETCMVLNDSLSCAEQYLQ